MIAMVGALHPDHRSVAAGMMLARIWIPRTGGIVARFPYLKTNRAWLKQTCKVKSPQYDKETGRWTLSKNSLSSVLGASIDRFGMVDLYRDTSALSRCDVRCQEASGYECDCSCYGANHGTIMQGWIEHGEFSLVADCGEIRRVKITYSAKRTDDYPRIYAGELQSQLYTTSQKARRDWPLATEFVCASCLTDTAAVWDHCHTHGYVRAPLCNKCNTRRWNGWTIECGRTSSNRNVDTTYYDYCPRHAEREWAYVYTPCSP